MSRAKEGQLIKLFSPQSFLSGKWHYVVLLKRWNPEGKKFFATTNIFIRGSLFEYSIARQKNPLHVLLRFFWKKLRQKGPEDATDSNTQQDIQLRLRELSIPCCTTFVDFDKYRMVWVYSKVSNKSAQIHFQGQNSNLWQEFCSNFLHWYITSF